MTPATPNVEWALIADYAMMDMTGKVSVIGVFDRLWAGTFPSIHPVLFLVVAWAGEASRLFGVELRVWGPSSELLVGGQQQVQLGPEGRAHGVFRLSPLPLPGPGQYKLELLAEGTTVTHVDLSVEQLDTSDGSSGVVQ